MRGKAFKILLSVNIVVVVAKLLGAVVSSVAKTVGAFKVIGIPIGKPFGAVLGILGKPFSLVGKLLPAVLVVDVILLLIILIKRIVKKKKEAAASQTDEGKAENKSATSKWMRAFKE